MSAGDGRTAGEDGPGDETRARAALVATARHLASQGLSPGSSGNLSVRLGHALLLTPTGSALRRVRPEELALAPLGAAPGPAPGASGAAGGPRPSKELPLHRAVYAARPDARAVVHLHSPAAVAASCLEPARRPGGTGPLEALTPYAVMRLGDLPVAPYAAPGSDALAAGVAALAGAHPVLLLANHGSLVAGPDLDAAVDLAEELEAAAALALALHGVPHRALGAAAVAALRARRG
ncbi:class II aldolase/adducin family protein [Cellulomonas endophytica]|uniref:class II aldolase/adducin family protein n=1 Tax=Cellulomonas endophytica TaxID=2494735 RepID=UPI0010122957|nr:class II aldolase/adducin family protein [Cellulomonas endophytica]